MAVFNVSSSAELYAALNNASGGDEIRLASGDYGDLDIGSSAQFSSEVTIISADPADPASFSSMLLKDAANITFDGVNFDYSYSSGDQTTFTPFQVRSGCENITFRNGEITGDNDGSGYPTGNGLYIRGSSNITIDNMDVSTWHRGFKLYDNQDITIINSEISDISGDGLQLNQVQGLQVENNYFHDFNGDPSSATHRDMIQIFSAGSDAPTTDVVIRSNTFDIGDGAWTQTIFMRNEEVDQGRAGQEMYYQNILIENNYINNAHTHGITVGEANGLIIRNNSIIAAEVNRDLQVNQDHTGGITIPMMGVAEESISVTIENNVVAEIRTETQSGWNVSGNVAPEDYIGQPNVGSTLVDPNSPPYEVESSNEILSSDLDASDNTTDAASDGSGVVSTDADDGANIDNSGDGSGAVSTDADDGANIDNSGDGTVYDTTGVLEDFDGFVLNIAPGISNSDQIEDLGGDAHVKEGTSALSFDGDGDYVSLGRLTEFEQSEQIAFTIEFTRNEADGSHQRLVWNHEKIGLELVGDGLIVKVANNDAAFHKGFRVDNIGLNDTDAHRITVVVDQNSDRLQVLVDDTLVLEESNTDFNFAGAGGHEWGWTLGTPWGRDVDGTVSDFRIDDDVAFVGDAGAVSEDAPSGGVDVTDGGAGADTVEASDGSTYDGSTGGDSTNDGTEAATDDGVDTVDNGSNIDSVNDEAAFLDDFVLDVSSGLNGNDQVSKVAGDAHVVFDGSDYGIVFDGNGDYVSLGRLTEFEQSEQIAFTTEFTRNEADGSHQRLVWNHEKIGLELVGDGLVVKVANNDAAFHKGFRVDDIGLNDTDAHRITVVVDQNSDRLQVIVDDTLVFEESNTDFDFAGAGGHEWGWTLGTPWGRDVDGTVSDFRIDDDVAFVGDQVFVDDAALLG